MDDSNNHAQDEPESNNRKYQVIGTRPVRPDGVDKVTGRALYGADFQLPGMLFGAVLRSPHAHARILSIDVSQAAAIPGVKALITSQDMPKVADKMADLGETSVNLRYQRNNLLAEDKVLYHGHAVAAVAATSRHIAEDALELIKVNYEVLPPVLDVRAAMDAEAPLLLPDLRTDEMGEESPRPSNVASHSQHKLGDLEAGFKSAAVIVEREFVTGNVHQGYIEPHNVTALYNHDGQVTIWCSTQAAFNIRDNISELLSIPVSRIRVVPMEIGGGFGGKNNVYLEPLAILLSKKCGYRPVKMTMNYSEVLSATGPTSASYIKIKIGADGKGRITAAQAYLAYAAGAYPGSPIWGGMGTILGCYKIDNLQIDGYDVVVNKPRTAAYRAPGATNAVFASETVIDEVAQKLGIDPLEFRLINVAKQGDRSSGGPIYPRIGFMECLEAARNHPHYSAPLEGANRGRGVAIGMWFNYGGKSSASASINQDGTISLVEGSVDIGGSRASIAMQLAETLQIPATDVKPQVANTDSVGYTEGTYGSRTTFATGWAVYELGCDLLQQLTGRAAKLWEMAPEKVKYEAGVFWANGKSMTFKELAGQLDDTGSPVMASVSVRPGGSGPAASSQIVDVEVDPETGKVDILRYTVIQDAGTAIHPSYVEGQLQGGVAQGIGWGLNEGYFYDREGHLLNANLLDYRIPTALDLPMIDTVIVEVPNPGHPYGVRGVGEAPITCPPAALANAIYRAVGVRMAELPMTPGRVLEAILDQKA